MTTQREPDTSAEGWQPIDTAPNEGDDILVFGGRHERVEIALADGDYWRRARKDGLKAIPTHWRHLPAPPLNQEGGDAAETAGRDSSSEVGKHVAPPASANAGTGRATLRHPNINHRLREWHEKFTTTGECSDALVAGLLCAAEEIEALRNDNRVVRSIALAEGKRIGIEEAVVEQFVPKQSSVQIIADAVRYCALTGDPQT